MCWWVSKMGTRYIVSFWLTILSFCAFLDRRCASSCSGFIPPLGTGRFTARSLHRRGWLHAWTGDGAIRAGQRAAGTQRSTWRYGRRIEKAQKEVDQQRIKQRNSLIWLVNILNWIKIQWTMLIDMKQMICFLALVACVRAFLIGSRCHLNFTFQCVHIWHLRGYETQLRSDQIRIK